MMASRPTCPLLCPTQSELNLFLCAGFDIFALAKPLAMKVAIGYVARDGCFEPDPHGERWFAFEQHDADDIVFWHQPTARFATWTGRAFALGQAIIDLPETYAFDCALNIFDNPMDWLRTHRDGIVVLPLRWALAFDRLRDCPRIAIAEPLVPIYRRWMKPGHMPELSVLRSTAKAAA